MLVKKHLQLGYILLTSDISTWTLGWCTFILMLVTLGRNILSTVRSRQTDKEVMIALNVNLALLNFGKTHFYLFETVGGDSCNDGLVFDTSQKRLKFQCLVNIVQNLKINTI